MQVLGLNGQPLGSEELERVRSEILSHSLVKLGNEYPFAEDLIVGDDGAADPKLPVLAKVSSLVSALQLGGPYELVERLWGQFRRTARQIDVDVQWNRDEVLVSNLCPSVLPSFHF